jgi:hypothetical protein
MKARMTSRKKKGAEFGKDEGVEGGVERNDENNKSFKNMTTLNYFGKIVTNQTYIYEKIKRD